MPFIPKEPNTSHPDQSPQQYPPYGVIHSVECTGCETVQGVGKVALPTNIKYNVSVNLGYGPVILQNVPLAHRRPNVKVIVAEPGDLAGIFWSDDIAYFTIIEPPYFKDCDSTTGGGNPPPFGTPPPRDEVPHQPPLG